MKVKQRKIIVYAVLALVVVFIVLLRFKDLSEIPPSLFIDEIDAGYQAYSFFKTGKDYFGNFLPISFHSLADYRAPLYIYSAVPTIALFGLNEWGVRLPAAIFGLLSLLFFFLFVLEISRNRRFAIISTLLLSITPWHFHYSRAGFEVTLLLFLITLSLFLFFVSLRKRSIVLFVLSFVCLSLGLYAYAIARLFVPLLIIFIPFIYRQEIIRFGWKKVALSLIFCILVLLPLFKDALSGGSLHRFSYINIFSDSLLKYEIDRERLVDTIHGRLQTVGMSPPFVSHVFHNKPLSWSLKIVSNYITSFSSSFLFLSGDPNLRHGVGRLGLFLVVLFPLLLVGIFSLISLIREKSKGLISAKDTRFLLIFLFLAPLPASITYDGGMHATRLFLMILPMTIIISLGFWEVQTWFTGKGKVLLTSLSIFLITINFIYYLHIYFYHYAVESEEEWDFGLKDSVQEAVKIQKDYDKIVFSNGYKSSLLFFLFWSKFPPAGFRMDNIELVDNDWITGKKIGKYYFGNLKSDIDLKEKKDFEKVLIIAGRNDFSKDLEKATPSMLKYLKKISLPSGRPILYLLRN